TISASPRTAYATCRFRNCIGSPFWSAAGAEVALYTMTRPKATSPRVMRIRSCDSSWPLRIHRHFYAPDPTPSTRRSVSRRRSAQVLGRWFSGGEGAHDAAEGVASLLEVREVIEARAGRRQQHDLAGARVPGGPAGRRLQVAGADGRGDCGR